MLLRLKKDDDLFKSSTMSFGEHLEELRGALFRAMAGVLVGLAITFPFADNAVRFVEAPLMRGLEKHYRRSAMDRLLAGDGDTASMTALSLVEDQQLLPREVYLERSQFEMSRGSTGAKATQDPSTTLHDRDIDAKAARSVVQSLMAATAAQGAPLHRAIWQAIPAEHQARLAELARAETSSAEASRELRQELARALDASLDSPKLVEAARSLRPFRALDSHQRTVAESIHRSAQQESSGGGTGPPRSIRQFNRILLASAFPDAIRLPQPDLVKLTVWEGSHARIQTLGVPEAFMAWMKAWLVLTVLVSSPWIFYQIWMFVAAGLYGHERQLVYVFLPFSLALFLAGAALAFVFVFDPVLDFLFEFNRILQIDIEPRFKDWMGFVLLLPLCFGVAFQLPLVMLAVERLGVVTINAYVHSWRYAVLGIFVISMVLTPTADPITMLLMAIPLTFLYFGGILLCRLVPHHKMEPASP